MNGLSMWTHADNTDTAVIVFCQGPDTQMHLLFKSMWNEIKMFSLHQ